MDLIATIWTWFCFAAGCFCLYKLMYRGAEKLTGKVLGSPKRLLTIKSEVTGKEETLELSQDEGQNIDDIFNCTKTVQEAAKLNSKLLIPTFEVNEIGEIQNIQQLKESLDSMENQTIVGPGMSEIVLQVITCKHDSSKYLQFVPGKKFSQKQ